ncbi:hypothetical protein ACWEQO_34690, partial [Streptomyces sp. NPDC004051]
MTRTCRLNCIIPPHLLEKLLRSDDSEVHQAALATMLTTASLRGERAVRASFASAAALGNGRRTVFDCRHGRSLPLGPVLEVGSLPGWPPGVTAGGQPDGEVEGDGV